MKRVVLKFVLLGSFLLLFPFWFLGGSGSFDLCCQSVNVDAVIFGTKDTLITTSNNLHWVNATIRPD